MEIIGVISRSMELWSPNRRMNADQIAQFADNLVSDYPHESLSDINVFMRKAAMGGYDAGEYYANLDPARMGGWWRKYLEEKAEAIERTSRQHGSTVLMSAQEQLVAAGVSTTELRRAMENAGSMENRSKRDDNLRRTVPLMADDDLRAAYVKHKDAWARRIIMVEAGKRGLLGEEVRVKQLEQEAREKEGFERWQQESAAAAAELDALEKSTTDNP